MCVEKRAAGATLERQNLKETRVGNGLSGAPQLIHGLPWKPGKPLLSLRRHWNQASVLISYRSEFLLLFVDSGKLTRDILSCPSCEESPTHHGRKGSRETVLYQLLVWLSLTMSYPTWDSLWPFESEGFRSYVCTLDVMR